MPRPARRVVLAVEPLEARVNPVTFTGGNSYYAGGNVHTVALGDLDNDGDLDIAVGSGGSTGVEILLNDGTGAFTPSSVVATAFPDSLTLDDLNDDGQLDIITTFSANKWMVVALGNGNGTFQAPIVRTLAYATQQAAVADFNGDGKKDVVVALGRGAAVLLNDNSGTVVGSPEYHDSSSPDDASSVATGDFNGDGKQDFAVSLREARSVKVYLGDGAGGFAASVEYTNPGSFAGGQILAADFTGDGKLDLAVGYTTASQIGLLRGNGDGSFQAPTLVETLLSRNGPIAAGDLDLDGDMDLVSMQSGDGDEIVALNNGDGTFAAPVVLRYSYPGQTAIGDVTGDGLPDLVIGHALSPGSIGILVNATPVIGASAPSSLVADFGALGLQRWTATGGWKVLSATNAERASLSADGRTLIADFGAGRGLWRWTTAGGWTALSGADAQSTTLSADGTAVVADFGTRGLRRWTVTEGWTILSPANAQFTSASVNGDTIVADFGVGGLYRWTTTDGWTELLKLDAEKVSQTTDGNALVADFGANGVRRWTATSGWATLTRANAQSVAIAGNGSALVADFGANGVRRWTATSGWTLLHAFDARRVSVTYDGIVVADFGERGLRRWTPAGAWTVLTKATVQSAPPSFNGLSVAANFGVGGLKLYNTTWTRLSPLNAEGIWVG